MRVASLGLASVGLLEAIAGSWVSILGIRRRLYSVMDIIFEPLCIADQKIVLRLSPELVSELEALVVVGSLAVVNLRADFYCQIVATDASGDCMAGVAAECPEKVLREVSRHCLRKGTWTKLLPPSKARDRLHGLLDPSDEVPGDKLKGHPLWNLLAKALPFCEVWRERVSKPLHINVLELRAYLKHEKRIANRGTSLRVLSELESQAALGSLVKGRSSSRALNSELQRSLGHHFGSDVSDYHMYFDTKLNPADDPTRDQLLREPSVPLPGWWSEVCDGRSFDFDQWLMMHGAPKDYAGVDFGELCGGEAIDLRPQQQLRKSLPERELDKTNRPDAMLVHPEIAQRADASMKTERPCDYEPEAYAILQSFDLSQFVFAGEKPDLSRPGALDLFSGRAGVAKQLIKQQVPEVKQ